MTHSSPQREYSAAPSSRPHRVCAIRGGTVRFADRTVLSGVDLAVGATDRLAVIGDNGSGKSTLLHALAGSVSLSAGEREVQLPGGLALAEQRPEFPPASTITEALDDLLADVRRIEAGIQEAAEKLAGADGEAQSGLLDELSAVIDHFEARDGYHLDQRVDSALDQLSLGGLDRERPVHSLSGGERARLALAAALSSEAELLLLDEPTNDLDDAGIRWLEERLSRHQGALVIVTHDRVLLERFATDIVLVEDGALRRYGDGYAGYLAARHAERRRLLEQHEAWRRDLARNEALVAANSFRLDAIPRKQIRAAFGHGAFRARSSDHGAVGRIRQAKERVTRLQASPAPRPAEPLRFAPTFASAPLVEGDGRIREKQLVLAADSVSLGIDGRGPRLTLESLDVREGDRWLVSGPNGAGKTTLLRVLAGEIMPQRGAIWRRPALRVAWLRQDLAAGFEGTLLDAFADATGAYRDDAADSLLGLGLFPARDLRLMLSRLSVGQRRRFEVAVAVSVPSDVLLLDEPTNHLAPELVEQLEKALLDYPGAVLTVTHDRRWREHVAGAGQTRRIEVISGGQVSVPHAT
ncbi:ABC-F family ATP-binding cassette domain-containing protein [Micromonospora sp. C32]|uniref:ABC-F family ATP-binding cassette domain-containing protein n=1 Tax=Micromonospora sp. C32 TaxID=2824877 RepID=UPI001FFDC63A|nr:ATP-binding cassette domain-containing protein [Micromonospora sp. C32]